MITLAYYPVQASRYFSTLLWSDSVQPQAISMSPAPGQYFYPQDLMIVMDNQLNPPETVTRDIHFGWKLQGHESMGSLRDKSVQHLSARGDLVCSVHAPPSGAPGTSYPLTPNHVHGSKYVVDGKTLFSMGFIPWGADFYEDYTYNLPSIYSPGLASWVDYPTPIHHYYSAKFTGNYAVVEGYKAYHRGTVRKNGTYLNNYGMTRARFFRLTVVNGVRVLQSSQLLSANGPIAGGLPVYTLPGGSTANALTLLPGQAQTLSLTWTTLSSAGWGSGQDGIPAAVSTIEAQLTDPVMVRKAWSSFVKHPCDFDMGDLGLDIIRAQKHVDANLLLTAFDLVRLKADIASWKNSAQLMRKYSKEIVSGSIRSFKQLFRWAEKNGDPISDAYLGYSYGVAPTMRDGAALMKGVKQLAKVADIPSRKHARRTSVEENEDWGVIESTHCLTVESDSLPTDFVGNLMRGIRACKEWGVYPSFTMLWDFIPYSFVLDWFTDFVDKFCTTADGIVDKEYFPIQYCIMSVKRVMDPPLESWVPGGVIHQVTGSVSFTYYDRTLSRELPVPILQLGDEFDPLFDHWAEAGALIVQRR